MTDSLTAPIYSVLSGTGEADHRVVFLHGLFGRGKNFTTIAKGLAPEIDALLVDEPNHGRSGWTKDFRYSEMADLVAEHLRADFAADGPVDIVGHSMGGKVAMVLALRHPDLVRRLVVLDISPVSSGASRGEFPHLLTSLSGLDLGAVTSRADADKALKELIPNSTVRGFLLQNLQRTDDGFTWEPNLELLYTELDAVMGFPDMQGAQFDGPVLWVGGGDSDYVSDDDEPAMRALFPKTVRMTMHGAGHWVHSQKPAETIEALRTFLLADDE